MNKQNIGVSLNEVCISRSTCSIFSCASNKVLDYFPICDNAG